MLHVDPHHLAVQVGETATLRCYHYPEDRKADLELDWFMPNYDIPISKLKDNQTVVNETQSAILRYTSENGTLTIKDAVNEDTGTYMCKNINKTLDIKSIFKVYEMPSYFMEAMVVVAINAVLVVIFITCYIWRTCRDLKERKLQRENRRKAKLGHMALEQKLMT